MKKFVALLTKEKRKAAMNEWENDNSDILQPLYSVCKQKFDNSFSILFFNCYFAVPWPTLGHSWGDNLNNDVNQPMLITAFVGAS